VALARECWPEVKVIGGESPGGKRAKAMGIARRSSALRAYARSARPDVALSHGSYAQAVAARSLRLPTVTMMDYEHQPANHLSFRLAQRVIVPEAFPGQALRRFGARNGKVVRYPGFKEEIYLAGFRPDPAVLDELGLDGGDVVAVMRPPPDGALYHRNGNSLFDDLLEQARAADGVQIVVLPRMKEQVERYRSLSGVVVPERPVDGSSLVGCADLMVGAGGTMNREASLLGTPTYTVFAGRLAALDQQLLDEGRLFDLRDGGTAPVFEKRPGPAVPVPEERRRAILDAVIGALEAVAR
jgi:predicted glycosyltransferase